MQYIRQTTTSNLNIHFFIRKIIATIYIFSVLQSTKLTTSHPQFPSLPNLIPSAGDLRSCCICLLSFHFTSFTKCLCVILQSIQSARLSLQPSELAPSPPPPPAPSPASECCPPPLWFLGWGEPIRTKGQTLWYSRYCIIPLRVIVIQ